MICGVDEAGRGPVMGPLVIAAVMVDTDAGLKELKVKDSKLLTRQKREALAPRIREVARVEVKVLSAEHIDKFRTDDSLNMLEAMAFAELIEIMSPDLAIVDAADVVEERFGKIIMDNMRCRPEMVCKHKADVNYPVVSAASIIAKTVRDGIMDDIGKELGQPVGSGYPNDETTRSFLEKWIRENKDFPPHTRRSWRTAKEIYSLSSVTRLTDWTDNR